MLVKTASQMTMEENHKYSSPTQQGQGYVYQLISDSIGFQFFET